MVTVLTFFSEAIRSRGQYQFCNSWNDYGYGRLKMIHRGKTSSFPCERASKRAIIKIVFNETTHSDLVSCVASKWIATDVLWDISLSISALFARTHFFSRNYRYKLFLQTEPLTRIRKQTGKNAASSHCGDAQTANLTWQNVRWRVHLQMQKEKQSPVTNTPCLLFSFHCDVTHELLKYQLTPFFSRMPLLICAAREMNESIRYAANRSQNEIFCK